MKQDFDRQWPQLAQEVLSGMKDWRLQHPRATLREMEQALDERLGKLRARLLEDVALASDARDLKDEAGRRWQCPQCHEDLKARGQRLRHLYTDRQQVLTLRRSYGTCPRCATGFFPPR